MKKYLYVILFGFLILLVSCTKNNSFEVIFDTNGGSEITSFKGRKINEEPKSTKLGYVFVGWYENKELNGEKIIFPYKVRKNITFYVKWEEKISYKVTFESNGGSELVEISTFLINATPLTKKEGYSFVGWYDNEEHKGERIRFPYEINEDLKLYAKWENITDTLFFFESKEGYVVELKNESQANAIDIPNKYNGKDVIGIIYKAFFRCSSLESIIIPSSVTSIGEWAFSGCSSLKSIVIPSNVISIEYNAFSGCSSLESVMIPSNVTSIGGWAFSGCSSLESIIIPSSVTSIGEWAFSGCSSLESIIIPSSVTSIGGWVFSGCSSLKSIIIPSNVTIIEYNAFDLCSSLIIYCEANSEPSGWSPAWNPLDRPVVWNYNEKQ